MRSMEARSVRSATFRNRQSTARKPQCAAGLRHRCAAQCRITMQHHPLLPCGASLSRAATAGGLETFPRSRLRLSLPALLSRVAWHPGHADSLRLEYPVRSDAWRRFCRSHRLEPSMSRKGTCWWCGAASARQTSPERRLASDVGGEAALDEARAKRERRLAGCQGRFSTLPRPCRVRVSWASMPS
jgi:hypothetical protein